MRTTVIGIVLLTFLSWAVEGSTADVPKLSQIRWDFESGDLQGWTQTGNLVKQPTSKSDDRHSGNYNKQGKYFIGTCELTAPGTDYDDDLTGELRSPRFLIDVPAMSLLVGGGGGQKLYVALCDAASGKQLMLARGRNAEAMRRLIWDLSELQGRKAYLKIVDAAKGAWGHINVDDIHALTKEEIEAMRRAEREKKEGARRKVARLLESIFKAERRVYSGKELASLGMPLGPIGGGSVYLRGTGELYRWEIFNNMNSSAYIPDQFFAIRAKAAGGEPVTRILRYYDGKEPGVKDIRFVGEFPIAYLDYVEPALPVKVSMTCFSPFIPSNAKDSALPLIFFGFDLSNESNGDVEVSLVGTLQNAVGYDGKARYEGVSWKGYGGNGNYLFPGGENAYLAFMARENSPASMGLAMSGEGAVANPQWADAKSFLDNFSRTGSLGDAAVGPSEKGKTWNTALASKFKMAPGEKKRVDFAILWYFPGRLGVGNMYENWFTAGTDLAVYLGESSQRLADETVLFHDTLFDTTLPYYVVERLSSQMSTPCTQLCMWLKDNSFFGWEGLHDNGRGLGPMNCNHVWNYEQTLARLFPEIEKRMRVIDLEHQMEENGAVHHRVAFPLRGKVTGPGAVCDGQASTVSKTYREHLMSADNTFLKRMWPRAKKAMEFMIRNWDGPDEDGVMRGKQFNTYDTHISGPNTFAGTQYLAALRAAEEMAKEMGDDAAAKRYRAIFEKGSNWLNKSLFNGEYFVQEWPQAQPDHDYGLGCHADQLMGQWWANQLNLGYLLPRKQVKSAIRSIFKYDFIPDFSVFDYSLGHRVFVWGDGAGLICCTWPKGGKPNRIILYAEEVWTGIEYEVAALMIQEGLINEALAIIRTVHDRYTNGRNPWYEIEYGGHYTRAMSSWSILLAAQGFRYHGPRGILGFAPNLQEDNFKSFFSTAEGWGSFSQKRKANSQTNFVELKYGTLKLRQLELGAPSPRPKQVKLELNGEALPAQQKLVGEKLVIAFPRPLSLKEGDWIKVVMSW